MAVAWLYWGTSLSDLSFLGLRVSTLKTHSRQCTISNRVCHGVAGSVVSVSFQYGIYVVGRTHTRSIPSLRSLPSVASETAPMLV